jgi:hypothetical protein
LKHIELRFHFLREKNDFQELKPCGLIFLQNLCLSPNMDFVFKL